MCNREDAWVGTQLLLGIAEIGGAEDQLRLHGIAAGRPLDINERVNCISQMQMA